jgi:hypothetical protein
LTSLGYSRLIFLYFVVILHGTYLRTIKVRSSKGTINDYLRAIESYSEDGRAKQRTIADLGRKELLAQLFPELRRLLGGDSDNQDAPASGPHILDTSTWGPVLAVRALFAQLGLWSILGTHLGKAKGVPFVDRAVVLIANRLIRPASDHGLAGWLETDFVRDRQARCFLPNWNRHNRVRFISANLEAWYRTLDQRLAAKEQIELALYHRLRDLFSLKPDLVLYDFTSTYFERAGPVGFAKHGYSRDGKPRNVQIVIGLVIVAGWPIAHHVWAGNTLDHTMVQEVVRALYQRFRFNRIVFVGDRGMVTDENLADLTASKHGYLVWLQRRCNQQIEQWLGAVDETKWIECPVRVAARERANPLRTRAQEVPSGTEGVRIIVVDSDERRGCEEGMRQKSMNQTLEQLQKLADRVAAG